MLRTLDARLDFAYIDGSHRAFDCLTDAVLTWPLMKTGGIIAFDDFTFDDFADPIQNPQRGIDGFLQTIEGCYALIHEGDEVAIRKTKEIADGGELSEVGLAWKAAHGKRRDQPTEEFRPEPRGARDQEQGGLDG